ncbi:MAG: arginine N-succinyltransferase [Bacteriovoracaceae bacterium]|nr:arginine N-succinyltransferase [Bacteriovoracaceae bacterium]
MFLLRSVKKTDVSDIFELSQLANFINLPPHMETINHMVETSLRSFERPSKHLADNIYMFAIEDSGKRKVVAVSLIHAQHGTEEEPHFYLSVGHERKFSNTLNTGFVHGTLRLGVDTNGPTEIGALILHPDYRGHVQKLGKQISYLRFLFIALHKERFRDMIHAELMPPFDQDGNSPLWEAIGRKFLNMGYLEADLLSRKSKEFITSLFPTENIYQTLLPAEARWAVGQVGKDTLPVKKMLEDIGFKYTQEVDPFDGGPHFRCAIKDIKLIQESFQGMIRCEDQLVSGMKPGLIHFTEDSTDGDNHSFKAIKLRYVLTQSTKSGSGEHQSLSLYVGDMGPWSQRFRELEKRGVMLSGIPF